MADETDPGQLPFTLNWMCSAGKQSPSFSGGQPAGTPVDSTPVWVVWAEPGVPSGNPDPGALSSPDRPRPRGWKPSTPCAHFHPEAVC